MQIELYQLRKRGNKPPVVSAVPLRDSLAKEFSASNLAASSWSEQRQIFGYTPTPHAQGRMSQGRPVEILAAAVQQARRDATTPDQSCCTGTEGEHVFTVLEENSLSGGFGAKALGALDAGLKARSCTVFRTVPVSHAEALCLTKAARELMPVIKFDAGSGTAEAVP